MSVLPILSIISAKKTKYVNEDELAELKSANKDNDMLLNSSFIADIESKKSKNKAPRADAKLLSLLTPLNTSSLSHSSMQINLDEKKAAEDLADLSKLLKKGRRERRPRVDFYSTPSCQVALSSIGTKLKPVIVETDSSINIPVRYVWNDVTVLSSKTIRML